MSPLRDSKGNPAMLASLDRRLGNNTLPAHPLPFLYLQFEVYNKKKKVVRLHCCNQSFLRTFRVKLAPLVLLENKADQGMM